VRGLDGKTAIVTGGSTLIGQAVVRELHAHGVAVAIADVDAGPGEKLAGELGARCLFALTDVTDDARAPDGGHAGMGPNGRGTGTPEEERCGSRAWHTCSSLRP
jgi:NAD(P)-dependent dehydrogenase (short-subunit alcohol dehydrogenase family)